VHDFMEKNNMGWLKPERFNNYSYLAQMEIYEEYFYDFARWLVSQTNRVSGSGYADIPKQIRQKLEIFHKVGAMVSVSASEFTAPTDSYKVMDLYYGGQIVDKVDYSRLQLLNLSNHTAPSTTYPVYYQTEDSYIVYPVTITSGVTCNYFRKPADPNWTYNTVAGNPVFNQSDVNYQDFEIHPADEPRLVMKILGYVGITVREQEVVQYAELQEQQKKQVESR